MTAKASSSPYEAPAASFASLQDESPRLWLGGAATLALGATIIAPTMAIRAMCSFILLCLLALIIGAPWQHKTTKAYEAVNRRPPRLIQAWAYDLKDDVFRPSTMGWGRLPSPQVLVASSGPEAEKELRQRLVDAAAGQDTHVDLPWVEGDWHRTLRLQLLPGAYKGQVVGHTQDVTGVAIAASTAHALVDAFPSPACLIDNKRCIIACNDAWQSTDGVEPGTAVGEPVCHKVNDDESAREIKARIHRCLTQAQDEGFSVRIRQVPHRVTMRHLDLADGPAALVVAEQRSNEENLERSVRDAQGRLEAVIQGAPISIVEYDADGLVVNWNKAAETSFGWPRDEAIGKAFPPAPPGYEAKFADWNADALRAPQMGDQVTRRHVDGRDHRYEAYTAPLRDHQGRAKGFVALYVDPADRDRLQRQQAQIEELQSTDALKSTFLSTAAHELATPLTPLKIQLVSLVRTADEENRPRFEMLSRNINRMERLVRDILDAARLESNRLAIEKGRVDTAQLATGAIQIFADTASSKGLTIVQDIDHGVSVDGDPIRLDQVVVNLLSNAIKFTPEGGTITISVKRFEGGVRLQVKDTGMGLAPEQVEGLFRPFTQFHRKELGAHVGTGLGLYISQGIIRAHGGTLRCESAGKGQGTTFSIWLPLQISGHLQGPALDIRKA